MSGLLDIVTGALEGIDIEGAIGGEVGNLSNIAATVSQLTQGQPLELGSLVGSIAEMEMPGFDFADELIAQVGSVRDIIPSDIGDVLGPVGQALGNIDSSVGEGLTDIIEPLISAFRAIETLIHTDFSFGHGEDSGDGAGEGGGESSSPAVSIISSNPDTQINPARLAAFSSVLAELPVDPSIGNLLQWFSDTVTIGRGDAIETALRSIPYLDDIRGPVDTVLAWQSMSSADLQTQLANTIQTLAQALADQTSAWLASQLEALNTLVTTVNLNDLRQLVNDIKDQLDELKNLIDDGTLSDPLLTAIEDEIAALMVQRDALAQQYLDNVKTELERRLKIVAIIPDRLEENMSALLLLLQPPAALRGPGGTSDFLPAIPDAGAFAGLDGFLDHYKDRLENLMSALDISDVAEAFAAPAAAINSAVDELDQAITMVTLDITNRLNQVEAVITSLNLPGIVDDAEQAIEDYTGAIVGTLSSAFSSVRDAIEGIADQISAIVTTFNPAGVVSTIENGIDAVADELNRPEISSVLEVIEKLKSIAERLDRLSFTPVGDTVVGTIDDMASAVQGLGASLDDPLKGLLRDALSVLPDDLHPVTDPLVEALGDLIEAGPIPLLQSIKDAPQEIVDAINNFDPGELIGDSLSAPFQQLMTELDTFEPTQLLEPIAGEIDKLKSRIRENARPGALLDPLIAVHEQILNDLEGFDPGEIIDPINEALKSAVEQITESIPIEGIFDEIEKVINDIQRILGVDGVADSMISLIQSLRAYLTPFVDATEDISSQIQSWLEDSLVVVDAIDISSLQTAFTGLSSAIDGVQAAALQSAYDTAVAPINTALVDTLKPAALMTALVKSHSDLRGSWNGMAESVDKTRIETLLLAVNPTAPEFTEVFTAYSRVVTVLGNTQRGLQASLQNWDEVFHSADGVLASYRQVPATPAELKQWMIDSLENQLIKPLQSVFEKFAPTGRLLDAFIGPIIELITELRDTVTQIVAAPAAIVSVGESLEQMRDRLQELNLDFISDSIDDIFDEVKTQFRGIDPRGLKNTVNEAFDRLLDVISLDQIVPLDALNRADDDIDAALEGLRKLDPQTLIADVIQPKFDEVLAPFISALDLTPALTSLAARLQPIEAELDAEMDRVNTSYGRFINSVQA